MSNKTPIKKPYKQPARKVKGAPKPRKKAQPKQSITFDYGAAYTAALNGDFSAMKAFYSAYTNFTPSPLTSTLKSDPSPQNMSQVSHRYTTTPSELIQKFGELADIPQDQLPVEDRIYSHQTLFRDAMLHDVVYKINLEHAKGCDCISSFTRTLTDEAESEKNLYCTIVSTEANFSNSGYLHPYSANNGYVSTVRFFTPHARLWSPTKTEGSNRDMRTLPNEYRTSKIDHTNSFLNIHVMHLERVEKFDHVAYLEGKFVPNFLAPPKKLDTSILDAIILPHDTKHEICSVINQTQFNKILFEDWGLGDVIEYGRGMTLLFHGPPGTGKTYCARKIAEGIKKPLMSISTAELQTSEPGGMERAIKQAFATAKSKKAVLFLDECDGIVASRKGMGMILSAEINALLTEIEKFEGILILATNRLGKLDPALERRVSLIVEFPKPDRDARFQIWTRMIPSKMPLHENVKIDELAEFDLTGGQIKNVLLNAARLALIEEATEVGEEHFSKALSRIMSGQSSFKNKTTHI